MKIDSIIFLILISGLFQISNHLCTHPVFCSDAILKAISESNLFPDSKTFVDLPLKVPVDEALDNFCTKSITEFVNLSFHTDPEAVLEIAELPDFKQNPDFLSQLTDSNLRQFGNELNRRWKELSKKVVLNNTAKFGTCKYQCTSYIEQIDGRTLLIPGGRFRESYYWDTYWIIIGLITSDMLQTAEHILDTFKLIIDKYQFIPNGLRQYYLNRSQPPFFFLMVKKLSGAWGKKGDLLKSKSIQMKYFDAILKEHNYWLATHSVNITIDQVHLKVNQYRANTIKPRPQSYRQDLKTVSNIKNSKEKERVLGCLSSMAESGWDFSTRWLANSQQLTSTIIDELIPTDLNALLALQESYLASLSSKYDRKELVDYFIDQLLMRRHYFNSIKKDGKYPDYNFKNRSWIPKSTYPSDYFPFQLFDETPSVAYIFNDLVNPTTSKIKSGQQWDSPNVWAPNSWILHEAINLNEAKQIAYQWVKTTYCGWRKTGNIYQKYRNDAFGQRGQGGEYTVQTGFGWTNGLILYYLSIYGDTMKLDQC